MPTRPMADTRYKLLELYESLLCRYGSQHWWPAETATETIIGCILVQHAGWRNVELAIDELKTHHMLNFQIIAGADEADLAEVIRSSGTAKVKANRLRTFSAWLGDTYQFDLDAMLTSQMHTLREELLAIKGIGPETADCILLYAAHQPSFVIDAYTHRILARHLLVTNDWNYDELKDLFESNLSADVSLFNEFHALLVTVGKKHCKKTPLCQNCPLEHLEHHID